MTHLKDISKVYLEQISESAVPGKPAERLGAVTAIPKSEQDAARERLLAKTKAKREKMKEERNDEPGEGTRQKYGDMRGLDRSGAPTSFGGKWKSKERKAAGAAALAKLNKEEIEIDEAVKGADPEMRKAASDERRAGDKRLSPSTGKGYADQQKQQISYMDKITKKNKNVVGLVTKEALDPVGQEDTDVDNDGKKNTKSDKYLLNRRKAIGKAIAKEAKVYDPMEDDDFDHDEAEENRGVSGKNNPKGGKALGSKKKSVKEGFSDWRKDLGLFEINATDEEDQKQIKEKKVSNVVKTSGLKVQEAVEEIGGTLLEMVEVDEFDFVVEGAYLELLEEGYDEDEIEEALEYALTEAKVTFGHDTASKPEKKKASLLATAREKLSGAKTAAKAAVARGARKVAKGALGVARKMEGGAPKTTERKPSTYRGAGAGTKEKVSSGSYTPPTKKKAEKPSDPWEGSATTPPKAKAKKTATPKKATAPKAKAPAKKKRTSKLDALLSDIRSESVQIDEKITAKTDMGAAIKDFYASKSPQLAGRTKEERRKAAIAAVLTARRGGRKLNTESMESNAPLSPAEIQAQKQKARLDLKIANLRNKELTKKNQSEV